MLQIFFRWKALNLYQPISGDEEAFAFAATFLQEGLHHNNFMILFHPFLCHQQKSNFRNVKGSTQLCQIRVLYIYG